jgi:hypothetical protein
VPSAEVARLQELLELWRHPDGHLTLDQMQDLAAWDQTSEHDREELMKAIDERYQSSAPPIHTIPLSPAEEEFVREHGLLDDLGEDKPDA